MTMNSLRNILSQVRPECDFTKSNDFFGDGLLDSFDLLVLVSEIDNHYKIHIDGLDIVPENFQSIDAIRNLLERMGVDL
jgi:methoxymalonate biosynthesis acyl carrier protein